MKNLILLFWAITSFLTLSGQTNFQWEKTDSVSKTKSQIYSDTKLFIAKTWKSSNNVIQLDDKETGTILIKAVNIQDVSFSMQIMSYTYNYTLTFKMKDNKYKITLDEVNCSDAYTRSGYIVQIQPFDGEIAPKTTPGINKKKAIEMMVSLKRELQYIVDSYETYIKKPSPLDKDGW